MLKNKWIASVLALALIVTPVQGVTAAEAGTDMEAVTAEAATTSGGNAVTTMRQSDGDNSGATSAAEEKLDVPTGLHWVTMYGDSIRLTWNAVESKTESKVLYDLKILLNGELCETKRGYSDTQVFLSTTELSKEGAYTFQVRARYYMNGLYPDDNYASDYSEVSEPLTIGKLATPTAKWGDGWMPVLDDSQNPGQIKYFEADMYKNGSSTGVGAALSVNHDGIDYTQFNRVCFLSNINGNGDYQFTLRAYPTDEARDAGLSYSPDSELSEAKTYVKPSRSLDVPVVKAHTTLPGVFEITNLNGAIGCTMELYYDQGSNGANWIQVGTGTNAFGKTATQDKITYYDFRQSIDSSSSQYGFGQYKLQARAISGNIDEVANSDLSSLYDSEVIEITASSLPLDMTPLYSNNNSDSSSEPAITPATTVSAEKAAEIKNSLQNIISNNTNATDAVANIKDSENKEELGAAMQQDGSVAELMNTLEKDYVKENNITVSKNIQSQVNTFMDPNAISVVGAGLNVTSGNVALDVSVPTNRVKLGNKYNNWNNLQFEIKLVGDELAEHGKLEVPVLITMPIPKGLRAENLEIIHCKADGSFERISPRNNGDGTISFAVTEFSTFAFVSPAETADNDDSDNDSASAEVVHNVDWNGVLNTVAANQAGTTDITTGNSMQVSTQLLQTLKKTKGVLALHTGKGITVSICGKDLKKTDKNVVITFAENPNIPASAKNAILANALYSKSFEMKEKMLYSVKMDIHFNVGKQFAGKYANLYHYDEQTGTMKLEGTFRITDTGAAMFLLYHGDEYILTVTEQAPAGAVAGGVANGTYTVVAGDTLSSIAAKNHIALARILAANPDIKNPNLIHVGQKIVLK